MLTLEEKRQRRSERAESDRRIAEARQEAQEIVATGKCPKCGTKLVRNSSILGWYQCGGIWKIAV